MFHPEDFNSTFSTVLSKVSIERDYEDFTARSDLSSAMYGISPLQFKMVY